MPNWPRNSCRAKPSSSRLRAAADRGEQLVHLRLGQPDAGVVHPQRAVAGDLGRLDPDHAPARPGRARAGR